MCVGARAQSRRTDGTFLPHDFHLPFFDRQDDRCCEWATAAFPPDRRADQSSLPSPFPTLALCHVHRPSDGFSRDHFPRRVAPPLHSCRRRQDMGSLVAHSSRTSFKIGKASAMKKFTKNASNTHRRRGTPDLGWGGREYLAVLQLSFFSPAHPLSPPSLAGRNDDTCSVARHAHAAAAANSLLRLARAFCGEGGWRQTRIYRMDFAL